MSLDLSELLHARIEKHCAKLHDDGHYASAASEAFKQVELALKEKSGEKSKYGVNLINSLFGEGKTVKLRLPFGEELQKQTEAYFKSVFSFYRNYAAHDGRVINRTECIRMLIVASELLDLLGASSISFSDIGGIEGLVKAEVFVEKEDVCKLLQLLNAYAFPIIVSDGYFEDLALAGLDEEQVQALVDVGLLEFSSNEIAVPVEAQYLVGESTELIGHFGLTMQGQQVLASHCK